MTVEALRQVAVEAETHLRAICSFMDATPMRAAVDKQSFDALKPGVLLSIGVMKWSQRLTAAFVAVIEMLAKNAGPSDETVCCVHQGQTCVCCVKEQPALGRIWVRGGDLMV